ncbi:MAG: indole-3-glycerol phosphate synthase TrpC [Deltaproteobacteria bacterium]|nr:indole-3-glycerol phosphate synthase TrpC [Deltaproteobacteria bacterium]
MAAFLETILAGVREDLGKRKAAVPFPAILERARQNRNRRDIRDRLGDGPGIVAEIKRASPSLGWIRKGLDAAKTARSYADAGACAVSVLTEGRFFGGSLDDLSAASKVCGTVPALRKDFVLDEYMVAESRAHGADLVLLIVAVLGKETGRLVREASSLGMEALVEVHDEKEMELAAGCGATLIGINNRDLATLRVDLGTSRRLLPMAPGDAVKVVESGITSPSEVRDFSAMGADAFLVGEALVRAEDPGAAIRALRGERSPANG